MKTFLRHTLRVFLLIIVLGLIALIVLLLRENTILSIELSRPQYNALSPIDRKQIIADLESRDPALVKVWVDYFKHGLELETNLSGDHAGLDDLFAIYKTHERPGRSNYFGDLLNSLAITQQTKGLTKGALLGYLGDPDKTVNTHGEETLLYQFTSFGGRSATGLVNVTNGAVSRILIGVNQENLDRLR